MRLFFFAILIFNFNYSYAWSLFGASTFEDCILENMKGVTNEDAALQIRAACMMKFPGEERKKCKLRDLTKLEASNVVGTASISNYGYAYFSGDFYNGNTKITLDEITVIFRADNIKTPQEYTLFMSNPIQPKSSGTAGIRVQVAPTKNFEWNLRALATCSK